MIETIIHSSAVVESVKIGKESRIGALTHVLQGASIGRQCQIGTHVFIEDDVIIGSRVTIESGVQILDGLRIEDDVFIGPNTTFANRLFSRSKQVIEDKSTIIVHKGASIGANVTILAGTDIGPNAVIGAGAVVTKDVPPHAIVAGNPACITGYVKTTIGSTNIVRNRSGQNTGKVGESKIPGVQFYNLPIIPDMRGALSFAEIGQYLPFVPKRYFLVFDVPSREIRGEHAHKECHQFLVCVNGSCSVMVDDGMEREEYLLDTRGAGLHIPPMVWGVQYKYSPDAVLMVLTSETYDPDDYIRDYREFHLAVKRA